MPRPRTGLPRRVTGAVAGLAAAALASGCSGAVPVGSPDLTTTERADCRALVAALPDSVSGLPRRQVTPEGAYGAAWGDPPIVLTCGVPRPPGLDRFASCQEANGVGWFVPTEAIEDQDADVVMTTIGRAVNVRVTVPAEYRPPVAAMVDLAHAIKQTVPETDPCV